MKVINYHIKLLEPALVTSLQGDPNSSVAFDYLPGSVLRGVFIGKYFGSNPVDASDDTVRRLFFDGTTRYLNGYPLDAYDHPGMPVPVSWQRVKDNESEIFDFAVELQNDEQQWQAIPASFYTYSGGDVRLFRPKHNVAVHTQRTARFGRAMPKYAPAGSQASKKNVGLLEEDEIVGAVYRYDALAAGQTFQASIICDNDADEATLRGFIEGRVTLGGSRSGGYGRAELLLLHNFVSSSDATWDEEDTPEDKLIVTLQSDVLLRDKRGQFAVDPELLRRVLGNHLGKELKLEDAFLDTETIGGFNRKWGLPLPQAIAVRMGSVLIFKDPGCDSSRLDQLEARGIGERRAEGFGRIAFNRHWAEKLKTTENTRKNRSPAEFKIREPEARLLAELMVKRMLKQQLNEWLLNAANSAEIANSPSNAQITRLRSIVIGELRATAPNIKKISRFIDSIQARSSARRQFERSTINGESLLGWLKRLLKTDSTGAWTMPDNEWRAVLHMSGSEVNARIGDVEAYIDNVLRLDYVLRLIDLVLAHAAKQSGRED